MIMKNEVKWKDYTICRWVVVFAGADICDEFATMKEARDAYKGVRGARFKYAAAEEINKDGDVNPAVYGDTLKEAMDKIKEVLS